MKSLKSSQVKVSKIKFGGGLRFIYNSQSFFKNIFNCRDTEVISPSRCDNFTHKVMQICPKSISYITESKT